MHLPKNRLGRVAHAKSSSHLSYIYRQAHQILHFKMKCLYILRAAVSVRYMMIILLSYRHLSIAAEPSKVHRHRTRVISARLLINDGRRAIILYTLIRHGHYLHAKDMTFLIIRSDISCTATTSIRKPARLFYIASFNARRSCHIFAVCRHCRAGAHFKSGACAEVISVASAAFQHSMGRLVSLRTAIP